MGEKKGGHPSFPAEKHPGEPQASTSLYAGGCAHTWTDTSDIVHSSVQPSPFGLSPWGSSSLPRAAGARTSARGEGLDAALPPHLVERERERIMKGLVLQMAKGEKCARV